MLMNCLMQCCAFGLGSLGLETSQDVARSRLEIISQRLGLVSGLDISALVLVLDLEASALVLVLDLDASMTPRS
jgi:hypothetical protein